MSTLKKLQSCAGDRKALFPVSMALSTLSALAGLAPFVIIWLIVGELFGASDAIAGNGGELMQRVVPLAWWAVGAAVVTHPLHRKAFSEKYAMINGFSESFFWGVNQ
jgi:ATP-binding cassette subfamily B protein